MNRAHPRYAVAVNVSFRVGETEEQGQTENISVGGLCAEVGSLLPLGTRVVIRLTLVFPNDDASEPIELDGRVVWCTPIDEHFQLGIQFSNLGAAAQQDLKLFIRFLAARP